MRSRGSLVLLGAALSGCPAAPLEVPPDLTLPSCAELDGSGALFIESRVTGAGVRSEGSEEMSWTSANPRFVALLPETEVEAGTQTMVGGLPAVLSPEPVEEDSFGPTFASLPIEDGTGAVWARVDLVELCGPVPPDAPLTVWISSDIRTVLWQLAPGD